MRLLWILIAVLGSAVCAQTPDSDWIRSIRLSMAGWNEEKTQEGMRVWRDSAGDTLSMAVADSPPPQFGYATGAELQRTARELAQHYGAGLIEVNQVAPPPRPIVSLIFKQLDLPAYVYTGLLIMEIPDASLSWTIVAREHGTTGLREAIITAEMVKAGELTLEDYERNWAQDPYDPAYHGVDRSVLRFLSDDKRYDARFPQHPLSKVRRVLAALPASLEGVP